MLAEDSEDRARGGAPPTGVGSADGATEPICAICHDELSRRTRMVVSMPVVEANGRQTCGHEFHWTCLSAWARRSRCGARVRGRRG